MKIFFQFQLLNLMKLMIIMCNLMSQECVMIRNADSEIYLKSNWEWFWNIYEKGKVHTLFTLCLLSNSRDSIDRGNLGPLFEPYKQESRVGELVI